MKSEGVHENSVVNLKNKFSFVRNCETNHELKRENFYIRDENGVSFGGELVGNFSKEAISGLEINKHDIKAGIYGGGSITGEAGASSNIMTNKYGAYAELGSGINAYAEANLEVEKKVDNFVLKSKVGFNAEALADANLKLGFSTSRKDDEIVSKGGIYGSMRAQANLGAHTEISHGSQDGYIRGLFNIQTGIGFGGAAGMFSEAVVDTKGWNVKFSTVVELDVGALLEFGVVGDFEGEVNIKNEVYFLREELNDYIKNKNEDLQVYKKSKKEDVNVLKEQIINSFPGWNQKIAVIKQSVKNKIENISTGFSRSINNKLKDMIRHYISKSDSVKNVGIFENVLALGKRFGLGAADKILDFVDRGIGIGGKVISKGLYYLLFPRIEAAINEIKPSDIIKNS
ncbi:MAG: hypothetical protein RMJ36_06075 [Candidatus Calescibacterium sp.]|nr:hypothetical protein [Candidatus Calescibacterium sp.]MDW8133204.1 hypothetical protein [Candidatus Calescibacterium sp.]